MKKYFCSLFLLVLLLGCDNQNTKTEKMVKQLQKEAEMSLQIENQLPLGFKFGLSKIQTEKIVDSLITNKVLSKDYYYLYRLDSLKVSCSVDFEYYRDSLYHLYFFFGRDNVSNLEELISSKISKELGSKYSKNHYIWNVTDECHLPLTFWIKDNKEIALRNSLSGLSLSYLNKPLEQRERKESVSFEVKRMFENMDKPSIKNSSLDGSVSQVERFLKSDLKDPDSYKSMGWGEVKENDKGYSVQHKYRAKNSFGGYVIKNETFQLDKNGKVIGKSE